MSSSGIATRRSSSRPKVGRDPDGPVLSRRDRPAASQTASRCARPSPRKAACNDSGSWVRVQGIEGDREAHVFIDLHVPPEIQAKLSRKVGTSPTVKRELLDLDAEGVRRRRLGHSADHSPLRSLCDQVRLAEPEMDRDDRRLNRRGQCGPRGLKRAAALGSGRRARCPASSSTDLTKRFGALRLPSMTSTLEFRAWQVRLPARALRLREDDAAANDRRPGGAERRAILIDGSDITRLPAHQRDFGMVFQSLALFPHLSVGENIAYPLRIRGAGKAERRRAPMSC